MTMRTHTANGVSTPCRRETAGSCRICELTDPVSSHYRADYAALYDGTTTHTVVAAAAPPEEPTPSSLLAGDLLAAFTARVGADRAAKWVAAKLGAEDCGCEARRQALNTLDAKLRRFLGW
jgi:hypothetical protein